MSSAICFNLDQSKILLSGNGLKGITIYLMKLTELTINSFSMVRSGSVKCQPVEKED